jgi:arginine deiminase
MSDSESNSDIQKKVTNEFKNKVLNWVKLDDELRTIRIKMKEINKEKKTMEEFILNFLNSVDEKVVAIADGKLRRNVSKTKAPLKKAGVVAALLQKTGDRIKATEYTDHIYESRPDVERVNLKRTKK